MLAERSGLQVALQMWRAGSLSIDTATSRAIFDSAARSALDDADRRLCPHVSAIEGPVAFVMGSVQADRHASIAITRASSPCVCFILPPRRLVRLVTRALYSPVGGSP